MSDARKKVQDLAKEFLENDDPVGWFEALYSLAEYDESQIPWADFEPHPLLVEWIQGDHYVQPGAKTLVVGCGLGDDSEWLSSLGYDVTAFDISETAIAWCQKRFPETKVNYVRADLFDLPKGWQSAFDFIVEAYTFQALPKPVRQNAMTTLPSCLKDNDSRLLVICRGRDDDEFEGENPPWPVSKAELSSLESSGGQIVFFDDIPANDKRSRHFRIEYKRAK